MALVKETKALLDRYHQLKGTLDHNHRLYEVFEGDLLTYVKEALKKSLHEKAYAQAEDRIAPINVLIRLIDKLSKIYAKSPVRELKSPIESDQEIFQYYQEAFEINTLMGRANEYFNLFKNTFIEPFLDQGKPQARLTPSDRFFMYSNNTVNPMRPTHYVKVMGKVEVDGKEIDLFYATTDDEFLAFDEEGKPVTAIMSTLGAQAGLNPYGKINGVYINRSRNELTPKVDSDTLAMTILICVMLSDLNYALKMQCFSIIYGINVNAANLTLAPSVFWDIKQDPATQGEAKVGIIKPEVDSDKALSALKAQVALWMQTRNIKPGAIGELTTENLASGISKIVDEMDTSEDRQRQVPYFKCAEEELWDLVLHRLHPIWIEDPLFQGPRRLVNAQAKVSVRLAEQKPMVDRSKLIDDQIKMKNAGLQTLRGALLEIYPDFNEDQLQRKIEEIKTEGLESANRMIEAASGMDPEQVME